ncbi:hypothetical protein CaCOL14_005445 [Colletotrichum acutatum]|uniref:Uncharacterized protein n=1 Tax=Glomerella acutata TaxID=27357 RepID=A0AAD8XK11_GLOAC|nr:uncharacterized protein BDZ83DRAFT_97735 [Colletotrichum acutatum]KAK1728700.1 hypothetical protein BDZ83DRAFT_97735 [Colletotrichum acutatum]
MRTSLILAGIYATLSVIAAPITPPPTDLNTAESEPLAPNLEGVDVDSDASSMADPKPATGWPGYERPKNKIPQPSTKEEYEKSREYNPKFGKLQPRPRPDNPFKNPKWRVPPNDPNTFKDRNPFRSWPHRDPFKMPKKNPFKLPEKKLEPKPEPEVNIEPMPKQPEQKDAKPERYPTLEETIQKNAEPARYPTHEEWTEQSREMAIAKQYDPWHKDDRSPDAAPDNEPTYEPHETDARRVGN